MSYQPISMVFTFDLDNLRVQGGQDTLVVLPRSTRTVYELVRMQGQSGYGFSFNYQSSSGDYRRRTYDTAFVYELPFQGNEARLVMQGYGGTFSHQNIEALDFDLPEGTPIYAARAGRVVETIASNKVSCPDPVCSKFSNLVRILHDDGTLAEYVHLQKDGVVVKSGEIVNVGDLLGYSGNTGYSSAPHLHFAVYQQRFADREFLPTLFRTTAEKPMLLVQGKRYTQPASE